ncbi:MAG: hypothetical protein H0S85_07765 [Desulfovibrionaceae bacterium]|nr:hypothetical protein [Desulfovibrionaceae bacterium]
MGAALAAVASGLLVNLGVVQHLAWLAWVCLVPWLAATRGAGGRRGFLLGMACGVATWAAATWWAAVGLWAWNSMEPWRAALTAWLLFLYQAVPYGLAGWWLGARTAGPATGPGLRGREIPPVEAAAVLTLALTLYPTVVPGTAVNLLSAAPVLLQPLELGGEPLLVFLVLLAAAWGARGLGTLGGSFWAPGPPLGLGRALGSFLCAVLVVGAVWGYGAWRMAELAADPARVAAAPVSWRPAGAPPATPPVVAAGTAGTEAAHAAHAAPAPATAPSSSSSSAAAVAASPGPGWVAVASVQSALPISGEQGPLFVTPPQGERGTADVAAMVRDAGNLLPRPGLVLLPELPLFVECATNDGDTHRFTVAAAEAGATLLMACGHDLGYTSEGRALGYYNAAGACTPGAEFGPLYHKRKLVPFGEYVPFEQRLPWLRRLVPGALRYLPGGGISVLRAEIPAGAATAVGSADVLAAAEPDQAPALKVGALLCYEAHFAALARAQRLAGADVLVNLSDLAWFGRTSVTDWHMALARFRAVELRMPLILCGNIGPSVVVDALGRDVPGSRLPTWLPGVSTALVHPAGPPSFYALHGNWFLWVLGALLAVRWLARALGSVLTDSEFATTLK